MNAPAIGERPQHRDEGGGRERSLTTVTEGTEPKAAHNKHREGQGCRQARRSVPGERPQRELPFGYITQSPGGVAQPDPGESRAVQIAFERRANGASMGEIARWLNAQGFRPRGRNEIFSPFAVRDMLRNAFYVGLITSAATRIAVSTSRS